MDGCVELVAFLFFIITLHTRCCGFILMLYKAYLYVCMRVCVNVCVCEFVYFSDGFFFFLSMGCATHLISDANIFVKHKIHPKKGSTCPCGGGEGIICLSYKNHTHNGMTIESNVICRHAATSAINSMCALCCLAPVQRGAWCKGVHCSD